MPAARAPLQFQEPHIVHLSDKERVSGIITEEHIGEAISAMHRDGLVVLENAVDVEHCDKLNDILSNEAAIMAKLPTTHFNDNSADGAPTGNMSQGPPLTPDLMYTDVWANQPAATVISAILGPNPRINYVNGNTALGGYDGARQRVHADLTFNHAQFPFAIVTNYYLIDVSPANGSTELWLGSHRDTSFHDHRNGHPVDPATAPSNSKFGIYDPKLEMEFGIRDELLEQRRAYAPPIQPTVKKGSVVLRDLRLWHAGLANPSPDPRIMLAFVHTPWWYQCPAKVVLPEACRDLVEGWARREVSPVQYWAHFVPAEVDHKTIKFNPNFSSDNKGYLDMLPKDVVMGFVFKDEDE
ncbi:hypothetical protein jhhlp_007869 [Lomentospora prolificans]|uniref:Phytanoyl-CoA dioxygenase n=1 Tax=Lomentospora prolificans TaxID=41688 RepID=A0A2N3N0T9_9PEZI|nr:hypothetical protein jhhlp_007869 [Lomentospora prolificans]